MISDNLSVKTQVYSVKWQSLTRKDVALTYPFSNKEILDITTKEEYKISYHRLGAGFDSSCEDQTNAN